MLWHRDIKRTKEVLSDSIEELIRNCFEISFYFQCEERNKYLDKELVSFQKNCSFHAKVNFIWLIIIMISWCSWFVHILQKICALWSKCALYLYFVGIFLSNTQGEARVTPRLRVRVDAAIIIRLIRRHAIESDRSPVSLRSSRKPTVKLWSIFHECCRENVRGRERTRRRARGDTRFLILRIYSCVRSADTSETLQRGCKLEGLHPFLIVTYKEITISVSLSAFIFGFTVQSCKRVKSL